MATADAPTMLEPRRVNDNWTILPSCLPVPGMGVLPVNSFLLKGREPLLVDTGLGALGQPWLDALASEIDLEDLRWIWLSHMDADHIGNLARLLDHAPHARILTNFLGRGKMALAGMDVGRVQLLEPGATFTVGDRDLAPLRPPYYDAPETIGFFDCRDRVLFAADSFGALLEEPALDAGDVPPDALRDGLVGWASIDAPWLATIDPTALARTLGAIDRLDPEILMSGHLPIARKGDARNGVGTLMGDVAGAYGRGASSAIDPLSLDRLAAALG